MKIEQGFRPMGQGRINNDPVARSAQPVSFADAMKQQDTRQSQEQLQRKLQDIQRQGERLSRMMNVRELKLYRQMVKLFLEDTVRRGISLKELKSFDRRGRVKRFKMLDEVDAMLVEMAEELLDTEQGRIELLGKVGEIRGILINLLF